MINKTNIVAYINFLYQKKYNRPAPEELLESWKGLNDNETAIHLTGLYNHWGLDRISSKKYEAEFLNKGQTGVKPIMPELPSTKDSKKPKTPSGHPNAPKQALPQPKSGNNGWAYFLVGLLILGGVGYYLWYLNETDIEAPLEVTATDSANLNVKVAKPEPKPIEASEPEQTEQDSKNARTINELFMAESVRSFDSIYQYFDPNMQRYWDINYPTYEELKARFEDIWSKTKNNENSNIRVNKIGNNTYDVYSTFSYFSLSDDKQKRLDNKVRFIFNNEGKIIQTYGL
ncbi:MAG TPA: hypothetical protein PKX92_07630 [Edaphocola sp.]|nr:hypothetical protein [Edaphocola sp.]